MKQSLFRFLNGFCYSVAITMVIQAIVMILTGKVPMLPEFTARYESELTAFAAELMLIGVMSGITSAGTVVFEMKKIGILIQSFLFLMIMLAVWIPVACIVWSFHKYLGSVITTVSSIIVTYGICWGIQYKLCRKDIDTINAKLMEKKEI